MMEVARERACNHILCHISMYFGEIVRIPESNSRHAKENVSTEFSYNIFGYQGLTHFALVTISLVTHGLKLLIL